jgi:hypothetical protein
MLLLFVRTLRGKSIEETERIKKEQGELDKQIEQAKLNGLTEQVAQLEDERKALKEQAEAKAKQLEADLKEIAELRFQLDELRSIHKLQQNHADHQLYEMKTFLGLELGEPAAGGGTKISRLRSDPIGKSCPAGDAGIVTNDLILEIASMPINSAADFMRAQDVLAAGDVVPVILRGADGVERIVDLSVGAEGVPPDILEEILAIENVGIQERLNVKQGDGVYHHVLGQAVLKAVRHSSVSSSCPLLVCVFHIADSSRQQKVRKGLILVCAGGHPRHNEAIYSRVC